MYHLSPRRLEKDYIGFAQKSPELLKHTTSRRTRTTLINVKTYRGSDEGPVTPPFQIRTVWKRNPLTHEPTFFRKSVYILEEGRDKF
jgi:hypothetical protein